MREYAEAMGRDHSNLAKLRDAAEVAEKCGNDTAVLLTRAAHLAAIHKLPQAVWAEAVTHMVKADWSAKDTQEAVDKAKPGNTDKQRLARSVSRSNSPMRRSASA